MRPLTCSFTATFAAIAASATLACGGVLTGTDPGPPLAKLHGTISGQTTTALASPYAEFFWTLPLLFPGETNPQPIDLGVESGRALVPIQSEFPANFTLNIYAPPPDMLLGGIFGMTDPSKTDQFQFSLATVLVFDDVNRNGDFDLVDTDGHPTSGYYVDDSFAPDLLRGWISHGAVMYVARLPNPQDPNLSTIFANPQALKVGFQTVTECHLAGTATDTRLQVTAADAPMSLHLVEPTVTAVPESQPLWYDDATTLPDCVP